MATVEKRGDGWRVRWRDPDGKARSRQCPSARSARDLKLEVEESCARGKCWQPAASVRLPYLSKLIVGYLADLGRVGRANTTITRAHAVLTPFLAWVAERTRNETPTVEVLTRSTLEAYDAHHVQQGNGVSTRRTAMWALGQCWLWGWKHPEWRPSLTEPSVPTMPRVKRPRPVAATWAQLDTIVHLATDDARRVRTREWVRRTVVLLRGLGWRITQCLEIDEADVDIDTGKIRCGTGKGQRETEEERIVDMAPWLVEEIKRWSKRGGKLVGKAMTARTACGIVASYWRASGAPPIVYEQRPDHAFRIGFVSGLTALRADREAVEHYVGHAPSGMRGPYVDPATLPIKEVAELIPPVGPRVRPVSMDNVLPIGRARYKRASGDP